MSDSKNELDAATDSMNEFIRELQLKLGRGGVSVEVRDVGELKSVLSLRKRNGGWTLLLDGEPLLNASREDRTMVCTGGHLVRLFEAIDPEIRASKLRVENAIRELKTVIGYCDEEEEIQRCRQANERRLGTPGTLDE